MDKTMDDKFMYIPNDGLQNYPLSRLQLIDDTLGHSA